LLKFYTKLKKIIINCFKFSFLLFLVKLNRSKSVSVFFKCSFIDILNYIILLGF
jgi:hypothetical protein